MITAYILIAGAAVFLAGMFTGMIIAAVYLHAARESAATAPVLNTCECGHSAARHDPGTGRCHARVTLKVRVEGVHDHDEQVPCTCRQYVGPGTVLTFRLPDLPTPTVPLGTPPPVPADTVNADPPG